MYRLTDANSDPLLNNFRLTQPISAGDVFYVMINEETESTYQANCTCNLRGTVDFDCTCTDETGCNCDASKGYSGTNCDECSFGYEWQTESRTCRGIPQIIGIGGLETADSTYLGKITEAVDYMDGSSVCTIDSFFDATARDDLADGVYRGMVCDHVHDKAICCGGEFGRNGNRVFSQRDCLTLEAAGWDNSTVDALPLGLRFPSTTLFNNGTDDLWLLTGGESNYFLN